MSQTEEMSFIDVQLRYLLEQLIERLVTMGHHQGPLRRKVVVQVRYYLDSHISFACLRKEQKVNKF